MGVTRIENVNIITFGSAIIYTGIYIIYLYKYMYIWMMMYIGTQRRRLSI